MGWAAATGRLLESSKALNTAGRESFESELMCSDAGRVFRRPENVVATLLLEELCFSRVEVSTFETESMLFAEPVRAMFCENRYWVRLSSNLVSEPLDTGFVGVSSPDELDSPSSEEKLSSC